MYGERIKRWEHATEWPLASAAVVFLVAYAVQILAHDRGTISATAEIVLWATWIVFAVDYVVRLTITERRGRWFVRHLLDLAIVALPMLRPLRLMRFLTILALIQRGAGARLRGQVIVYTIGATVLLILITALAVLDAEQDDGGNIRTFGEAVWWALVTLASVGYGDYYPVTAAGRTIAGGLMVAGVALLGAVTATLASWIIERISVEVAAPAATAQHIEDLRAEIAELKSMLSAQRASDDTEEPHPAS